MQRLLVKNTTVNTRETVLSSHSAIWKTERFIATCCSAIMTDVLIAKVAEAVFIHSEIFDIRENTPHGAQVFSISTSDGEHTFLFRTGKQLPEHGLSECDIVFFAYFGSAGELKKSDTRFESYLTVHSEIEVSIRLVDTEYCTFDFLKLYRLSNSPRVNFPLLTAEQKSIVFCEDENVLVQGVAGSGKTNVCIDKIVFTACRAYHGKILYSTFSRGLLLETRARVQEFSRNLLQFAEDYESGRIIFADADRKTAVERRLGVYFSQDEVSDIVTKCLEIVDFLDTHVDYLLLEDMFVAEGGNADSIVGEDYFVKTYLQDVKNHQLLSKLNRIKHLSYEVVYKEIYGLIFGSYDALHPRAMLSEEDYISAREGSFSRNDCTTIYALAREYGQHMQDKGLCDNNTISRALLARGGAKRYSLAILDEVQDMTEVNLCFLKTSAHKLFCVGDALQMINPSYFSFAYLKRLLYEQDIVTFRELRQNYRSTCQIAEVIDKLGELNIRKFGTHSFVLRGEGVRSEVPTKLVYVRDDTFVQSVSGEKYEGITVIVADTAQKNALRRIARSVEILTVSEAKGLERDTVILVDLLSSNRDKWDALERTIVNRKSADENSVYRYYFNLLYVGLSRARSNVFVSERQDIAAFSEFFALSFESANTAEAMEMLSAIAIRLELDTEELTRRIQEFIRLGQYDNARFNATKLTDEVQKRTALQVIDVNEQYISHGKYREAGLAYWRMGHNDLAREQFELSGDTALISFMDAVAGRGAQGMGIEIFDYFEELMEHDSAGKIFSDILVEDIAQRNRAFRDLMRTIKTLKR